MVGGIYDTDEQLITCSCGCYPEVIWHYIKGTANRINYFIRCPICKQRTRDRRKVYNAIKDWNFKFIE